MENPIRSGTQSSKEGNMSSFDEQMKRTLGEVDTEATHHMFGPRVLLNKEFKDVPSRSEIAHVRLTEYSGDEYMYVVEYWHHEGKDLHMGTRWQVLEAFTCAELDRTYPGYPVLRAELAKLMRD
jgi:hypothetical protein